MTSIWNGVGEFVDNQRLIEIYSRGGFPVRPLHQCHTRPATSFCNYRSTIIAPLLLYHRRVNNQKSLANLDSKISKALVERAKVWRSNLLTQLILAVHQYCSPSAAHKERIR